MFALLKLIFLLSLSFKPFPRAQDRTCYITVGVDGLTHERCVNN